MPKVQWIWKFCFLITFFSESVENKPTLCTYVTFVKWKLLNYLKIVRELEEILGWGFLHVVTRSIAEIISASDVWPRVYWDTFFLKRNSTSLPPEGVQFRDFQKLHVVKHFKIVRKTLHSFGTVFWEFVTRTIVEITYAPRSTGIQSSPKEMHLKIPCSTCTIYFKWL